jgi:hypothetical protein
MIEVKQLALPPRMTNHEGDPRRIGVEIEFTALTAEAGAQVIRNVFGGTVMRQDVHRYFVRGTEFGDFTCELDLQYVHRADGAPEAAESSSAAPLDVFLRDFRETLRGVYGDVSALVVPCEIVCPPVPIEDLPKLEAIIDALRAEGAADTRASPLYGFGAHLNPEISDGGFDWIVAMLKSYLLLSDWLRAVMRIDLTRRLIAFTTPFPAAYVAKVVDPTYQPNQSQLIDDYLAFNPTRNRELDMLPLFAWLDGSRVDAGVRDRRIGASWSAWWSGPISSRPWGGPIVPANRRFSPITGRSRPANGSWCHDPTSESGDHQFARRRTIHVVVLPARHAPERCAARAARGTGRRPRSGSVRWTDHRRRRPHQRRDLQGKDETGRAHRPSA